MVMFFIAAGVTRTSDVVIVAGSGDPYVMYLWHTPSLVPKPFGINCVGGEREPCTHCFADVTLRYDFPQNVLKALYVPWWR